MILTYLKTRYRDNARGEVENGIVYHDCWSLVRTVRHELFGLLLLPSYGAIDGANKRALTRAVHEQAPEFEEGPPEPAAIATMWRNGLCEHIGICVELDGRLGVLETNAGIGTRWKTIADIERLYAKVRYYH